MFEDLDLQPDKPAPKTPAKIHWFRLGAYLTPFVFAGFVLIWPHALPAWAVILGALFVGCCFVTAGLLHIRDIGGWVRLEGYIHQHLLVSILAITAICCFVVGGGIYSAVRPSKTPATTQIVSSPPIPTSNPPSVGISSVDVSPKITLAKSPERKGQYLGPTPVKPTPTPSSSGTVTQTNTGLCGINNIGGAVSGNTCISVDTPPLKLETKLESSTATRPDLFRHEQILTITPNVNWQPVSIKVTTDAPMKKIYPFGNFTNMQLGVSTDDPRVGYIYFPSPSLGKGYPFTVDLMSDVPISKAAVQVFDGSLPNLKPQ